MTIDIKTVGTLGISFSRGLDQTWLNILRRDDGYTLEFYQNVEDEDSDEDDEIIDASFTIHYEQGEEILRQVFAQGRLEDWPSTAAATACGRISTGPLTSTT